MLNIVLIAFCSLALTKLALWLMLSLSLCGLLANSLLQLSFVLQYRSKASYHLSSCFLWDGYHFSQHVSRFSRDVSHFSRDVSRFPRESLKHLVWHILHVRNQTYVTIVALQLIGKLMGSANIHCKMIYICIEALIVHSIHIKQTSNVHLFNGHWICIVT